MMNDTIVDRYSIMTLAFTADSSCLTSGDTVVDVPGQKDLQLFELPVGRIKTAAIAPDGRLVITGSGREIRVWIPDQGIDALLSIARSRVGIQ